MLQHEALAVSVWYHKCHVMMAYNNSLADVHRWRQWNTGQLYNLQDRRYSARAFQKVCIYLRNSGKFYNKGTSQRAHSNRVKVRWKENEKSMIKEKFRFRFQFRSVWKDLITVMTYLGQFRVNRYTRHIEIPIHTSGGRRQKFKFVDASW